MKFSHAGIHTYIYISKISLHEDALHLPHFCLYRNMPVSPSVPSYFTLEQSAVTAIHHILFSFIFILVLFYPCVSVFICIFSCFVITYLPLMINTFPIDLTQIYLINNNNNNINLQIM